MTIFVLHDADHSGYKIARTLGEETTRMPGHRIEVVDLGLAVDDAIAMGMEPEPYTRDKALPRRIIPHTSQTRRGSGSRAPRPRGTATASRRSGSAAALS